MQYINRGWYIFPVIGKRPDLKHVGHWSDESSNDPEQVIAWFVGRSQPVGIGLDLGRSGLAVIDGDKLDKMPPELRRALDSAVLGAWRHQGNRARMSWMFTVGDDAPPQARHPWGEVKADGGYVVLAPSPHPDQPEPYQWVAQPGDAPGPLPPELRRVVAPASHGPSGPTGAPWVGGTGSPEQQAEARAALDRLASGLAEMGPGTGRNHALNRAAFVIGRYSPHCIDAETIQDVLLSAAKTNGLIADDGLRSVRGTIASGIRAGQKSPTAPDPHDWTDGLLAPGATPESAAAPVTFFAKRDLLVETLARHIVEHMPVGLDAGDALWGYDGGVWSPLGAAGIRDAVFERLGERYRQGHLGAATDAVKALAVRIDPGAYDPNLINVRNGMLDWRTGTLQPHDPAHLSTAQVQVEWNPDAVCPTIDAWLAEVLPADVLAGDPSMLDMVIGYLCMSGNPLHKALLLLGHGRNGKGTFLRLVTTILGRQNVSAVTLHDMGISRFSVADVFGKIANIAGDIDGSWLESTATFKTLTGGDIVRGERKYGQPFDFEPYAVPVFSANKVFGTPDTSDGYMSRWVVIPFPNSFNGREDRTLDARLASEAEGLFVRGVRGLRALMEAGNFPVTESLLEARERFERESDPVRAFLAECTVQDMGSMGWITRAQIWDVYGAWAAHNGVKAVSRGTLYERVRQAGLQDHKRVGVMGFLGRRLSVQVQHGDLIPVTDALADVGLVQ